MVSSFRVHKMRTERDDNLNFKFSKEFKKKNYFLLCTLSSSYFIYSLFYFSLYFILFYSFIIFIEGR